METEKIWSESEGCYVCFFRHFLDKKLRSVCRTSSPDFVTWSELVPLKPNFPGEHLYTTLTQPYFPAPQLYIATPTRFHPERGESTDILFMTARGNVPYDRTFREAFIRPGLDPARWQRHLQRVVMSIVGGVTVFNTSGHSNLNVDDSANSTARTAVSVGSGQITGLGAATMFTIAVTKPAASQHHDICRANRDGRISPSCERISSDVIFVCVRSEPPATGRLRWQ